MKLKKISTLIFLIVFLKITFADYGIKIQLESKSEIDFIYWNKVSPIYTNWTEKGGNFDCSTWNPNENTITIGQSFEQSRNCSVNEERFRQERSLSDTGNYRNEGDPILEERISPRTETNQSIGTLETWVLTDSTYTAWINSGEIYGCENWSPATNTVTINQSFTQTANDCELNQTRNRQDREIETTTNEIRNVGSVVVENQALTNQTNTRSATGTKETWVATDSTYTSWVNSGEIYGCSNWSPDPSTVNSGTEFTQTATNCSQNQTRNRQEQEKEITTGAIRNSGSLVVETQTINTTSTRPATGTKPIGPVCYPVSDSNKWTGVPRFISCSTDYYAGSAAFDRTITVNGVNYKETFQRGSGAQNGCRTSMSLLISTYSPGGDVVVGGKNVTLNPLNGTTGQICY